MKQVEKILKTAAAEIGYKEAKNNKTKYGKAYGLDGQPWCVMFLWWVFSQADLSTLFYGGKKIASCSAVMNYAKGCGRWITSGYQPGDLVIFDFTGKKTATNHIGIVESVSGNTLTTIEGNTSAGTSGSQSNGDGVYRRKRNISLVVGAYRPGYDVSAKQVIKKVSVSCVQIESGVEGTPVKVVQQLLNANSGANLSIDGAYGPKTKTAIQKFQTAHKLSPDGIVGKDTWAALLN